MWPTFLRVAAQRMQRVAFADEDTRNLGIINSALAAWLVFVDQPGQEHWHCACAPTTKHPQLEAA